METRETFQWTTLIGRELKLTSDPHFVKVNNNLGIPALHRLSCRASWREGTQVRTAVEDGLDWVETLFLGEQVREAAGDPRQLQFCWNCMIREAGAR
jgi:hypothetical protein